MRIALLSHQWPGIRMGGIGTAVRQCAAALAGAGHDVHVFTLGIPQELRKLTPAGVHLHEVADLAARLGDGTLSPPLAATMNAGGEGVYRLAVGWLLCAAVLEAHREQPFDVVEGPEVEALGLPLMFNGEFDAPVVTGLHCCSAIAHAANDAEAAEGRELIVALEFAAIHLADGVCAPTRAVVTETQRFVAMREAVSIVPHAYSCPARSFAPPPADGPMLFLGRIERLKGVERIAEALNLFLPRHPKAVFRFIGPDTASGPGGGSMRDHVRKLLLPEISGRVEFTGEIAHGQIERELRACSFCIQPSIAENFSMTCCEAMAAGRTVIVGSGTGSVEVVGDAGLAIDPRSSNDLAAAMERLWMDRALLVELSRRAYDRIRAEFSPGRMAEQRVAFYEGVIARFQRDRTQRLRTLSAGIAGAILPSLAALTGALAGVHQPTHTPGARLLRIMETHGHGRPVNVVLYGAGKHSSRLLAERHLWESHGHRVVGLIDDHPRFAEGGACLDLPVWSPAAMERRVTDGNETPAVVLSTDTYQDQFWAQTARLREAGVAVFRLY
jgi:glycosyltransferase involved in cell wall biosynthesis